MRAVPSTLKQFGLSLAAALVLACTAEEPATADRPITGGTVAVGVASRPTSILPPFATSSLDGELGPLLYLGLNFAEWGDGQLRYPKGHPLALARDWEIDGPRLVYHLDPSRSWSDGSPIRSGDVIFTYELLRELGDMPMSIAAARLDSVVAEGDSTVVFHFDAPYPGMLYDTGVGILPEHVFGGLSRDAIAAAAQAAGDGPDDPVVSGPFTVASSGPGNQLDLVPNEYSPVRPRLARLVFRVVPDPATRLNALRAGELDLVQIESYREAVRLAAQEEAKILRVPQRGYDYIAWNPAAHPALADPIVRRALSLAIDRDAILAALGMTEFADKAYGPYGSIFGDLAPDPPRGGDHDPAGARRLLSEAGWMDTGVGMRERDGIPLILELRVPAEHERRLDAAQMIQAQLADVGARIEIVAQDFNSLFARARARDYEAVFLGWQVGLDPDISFFWADPESPVNIASYDGTRRALAHRGGTRLDYAHVRQLRTGREAARLIAMDYPYAFLWYFDFVWLASKRLEAVRRSTQ